MSLRPEAPTNPVTPTPHLMPEIDIRPIPGFRRFFGVFYNGAKQGTVTVSVQGTRFAASRDADLETVGFGTMADAAIYVLGWEE